MAATTSAHTNPHGWHQGEAAVHHLLKVPTTTSRQNPTSAGLPPQYAYRTAGYPLVAVGTLDAHGRPWTSLWGGERGVARPVAQGVLALESLVDRVNDPAVQALFGGDGGELVDGVRQLQEQDGSGGKMMSGLGIDLEARTRLKLAGRMAVGDLEGRPDGDGDEGGRRIARVRVGMVVEESLPNCPKYLNGKGVRGWVGVPRRVRMGGGDDGDKGELGQEAVRLVEKADMFFLSSTDGGRTMDTNHRGGPRGFVRVVSDGVGKGEGGAVLAYPEYSGNRLYQTLGNLHTSPRVGIVVPDFETGDVLYLTGDTELLVGQDAAALMPHTKLVVKITVREARFVRDGLPFRGAAGEASPYNPPVRRLVGECPVPSSSAVSGSSGSGQARPGTTAALVKREIITPSIGRFTFKLQLQPRQQPLKMWKAGQHVTLDFSGELDNGWSHMRDDDPQSLNDDFVRTFTVSKPPPVGEDEVVHDGVEVEITARKHGPVTGLLWKYHIRVGLEIPVLGFGGDESFQIAKADKSRRAVFVAGGVGITPLLAQAAGLLLAGGEGSDGSKNKGLVLLWSLRAGDLELAVDTFERIQGLAKVTRLFVTGDTSAAAVTETVGKIEGLGAEAVVLGRMTQSDVSKEKGAKYYLCASVEMQALVQEWLQGEEVVSESFNY